MGKYNISRDYFPFSRLAPPLRDARLAGWLGSKMRPPRRVFKSRDIHSRTETLPGYMGEPIEAIIMEPRNIGELAPCLVYYHGGGFFFGASGIHYDMVMDYARFCRCKIVFVQYRLAPRYPFPTPPEDCYAALSWTYENAHRLGIDKTRIAVGGDSAGGALAAAVCQMARDRGGYLPIFQLLIYPVTDRRMDTASNREFTDTPMWNSRLSALMWRAYLQDPTVSDVAYASPMEAKSFAGLPPAYIETAEFDCLRDEAVAYADVLTAEDIPVKLNSTRGTMHGFDIVRRAPTTQAAVSERVKYISEAFGTSVR